ncbi:hypothetical protein B566_EDAN013665 [Ephemera danica]|nr:hypothetical protein B566_EDAN013665 [Ephemera danica]
MMKASPTSLSPNSKQQQRQSVRQSAGNYCYREINLRRYANLVQIILTPVSTKMKNALNVLRELKEALNQLKRDEGCRVVLLSSTGSSFCQGIDVHALIHSNMEKRRKSAQELAQALKEFLKALAHFTKPLAAAVHGPAVGLGVTMLPFFDMASELLYCCRKLTATEAHRAGLVTRILWPDRFQEELIPTLCTIAAQSAQAMEGSKLLLRDSLRSNLDAALEAESALLVQHWCSSECQNAYRALLEAEGVGIQKQRTEPVAQ